MGEKEFKYTIESIKTISSYLNSPESLGIKNLEEEKIGVRKGFRIGFEYSSGVFTIILVIDFVCRTEEPEPLKLFGTVVQYDYRFIGFEGTLKKDEKGAVDIPDDLLITLLSVSYSTTRGIIAEQTSGTEYSKYYLPLAPINEFKEIIKKLNKKPEENLKTEK